jgi:hypothetical protein
MQRHRTVLFASAIIVAFATPVALAQTGGQRGNIDDSNAYRSPIDGRSGGTGYGSSANAGIPSSTPRTRSFLGWQWAQGPYDRGEIGPDNAYHSPTDGRSGGAGLPAANGVVPHTSPYVSAGPVHYSERADVPAQSMGGNMERSPSDGRSGGTGFPSSQSGAVPSSTPDVMPLSDARTIR